MSLIVIKNLFLVSILAALLPGVWFFLKKLRLNGSINLSSFEMPAAEALASGIFLGAAFIHMLPEASSNFYQAGYQYPWSFLLASVVFLFLLGLEHFNSLLKRKSHSSTKNIVLLTAVMLSIHSFLEGAAVGVAVDLTTAAIIFVAIITHKGAASFALAVQLNRSELSLTNSWLVFLLFVLMTPLGIFSGYSVLSTAANTTLLVPIFNSLAAGTFLYLGTLHGLERAPLIKNCCNLREFGFMVVGFSIMAVVGIWL